MVGLLTDEPVPRDDPEPWAAWLPEGITITPLQEPEARLDKPFLDVLGSRRSKAGNIVGWAEVAELLWYGCRTTARGTVGRAGIEVEQRAMPSAGGLHSIAVVCQMLDSHDTPRIYLPGRHAFALLNGADPSANKHNGLDVLAMAGSTSGCTLRLVGDYRKVAAAYRHPESLLWRDAGVLVAGLCLVAEWLDLDSTPLGLAGSHHLDRLGFPRSRFLGVGAVHVGTRSRGGTSSGR